ncbi:hypothetical protein PSN45_003781 [Yamadazyma tenuis]|uniref:DUF2423 domain-containing protein n=1 Tax=Candida tenuis (strain ATCC 10573 / BCRC 21748 / CBS 615 / JCM 9827 / NBRC 10315 / NRRL Y-1498 / VKM Y-70) TaxID=590646 RepID=G3B3A2_CANTC|nr:uncharacterized protein CANTEDRAFT_105063 [Yamadazyma tenuis ATCC 10573]EGV64119.1 hypothetical protein CANTEDRAFT_105063 [Yamadazyma tenuis ATCC 10573]WEJ96245.1 hypothetical protein PSN45_003781 [Yamadazyma tenuis]
MAKSLRSKNVLRAKSIKRNKEFKDLDDKRRERLANKMKEELNKQDKTGSKLEDNEAVNADKKISTSGWRDSRKSQYKQKKNSKKKTGKALKF